ncbi:phosphoenolpyruvate hydrolase family protein [Streptomyces sp. GbtcB6]|uniref:phosphoenolpyruvate hydrolase family protein n=1 Tax=Streptomyces sp. GbtcB6 TaxID=2824751 RepID=UPI0020C615E0|nr:phosphoenolpyruvate hydrolase family protein [Streptomyces sp. GbtcB6]
MRPREFPPAADSPQDQQWDAAVAVDPDILVLCHGGPVAEPADAQYVEARIRTGPSELPTEVFDWGSIKWGE